MEETKTAEELLADIKSKDEEIQRLRDALVYASCRMGLFLFEARKVFSGKGQETNLT